VTAIALQENGHFISASIEFNDAHGLGHFARRTMEANRSGVERLRARSR
jgi:hypothetical protein